jgi:hypothetical protein
MNWKKGLFRLWVFGSVLWAIFVGVIAVSHWPRYSSDRYYAWNKSQWKFTAVEWRDQADVEKAIATGSYIVVDNPEGYGVVFGKDALSDSEMKTAVLTVRAWVDERYLDRRTEHFLSFIAPLMAPPLVVLLFGLACLWVLRGFRQAASTST